MSLSVFSFLMAVLWCNIFIIFISIMRKQTGFIAHFSITPLLLFLGVCVFRLCFIFEIPNAIVISSRYIFPFIIRFFTSVRFFVMNYKLSILDMLLALWLVGTIYFIGKYMKEAKQLNNILQKKTVIKNQRVIKILDEILSDSKKNVKVTLVELAGISSPMISGYIHPTIYLPVISFTDEELRSILLHEWTHFLHKDSWIKLLMCFICAVFWWNPFVHILKSNLLHILELRCDAKLISQFNEKEKLHYLESITKVLKYQLSTRQAFNPSIDGSTASVLVNTRQISNVEQRFQLILKKNYAKKYKPMVYGVYISIVALFLVSNLYVIQPVFSCEEPGTFSITAEGAYLLDNHDGTYSLYIEGEYRLQLDKEDLINEPFSLLQIK